MRSHKRPRVYPRYRASVRVTRYGGVLDEWRTVNLSEGGMFVEASTLLEPGSRVDVGLYIEIPGRRDEIVTGAEVMWRNHPADKGFDPDLPTGLGLRFTELGAADRALLLSYLGGLLDDEEEAALETLSVDESIGLSVAGPSQDVSAEIPELPPLPDVMEWEEADLAVPTERQTTAAVPLPSEDPDLPPVDATTETETQLLSLGTRLGSYRIIGVLGQGGMGTVYLAEHVRLGREVALKKLHLRFTADPQATQRFVDEARLVNQIRHEHITDVTDFVSSGADMYFMMELLEGRTLGEELAKHGTLPLARALHIALQLCDVLKAVHDEQIIHRDLKPDNILLIERDGDPDFVKLLDFGIAKLRESADRPTARRTATGLIVGTPGYIAPEHVLGSPLDHRVDVYGFGVVFYNMIVGKMPFEAEGFDELVIKQATEAAPRPAEQITLPVPDEIEAVIVECLDPDPDCRPGDMREVEARLRQSEQALWASEEEEALAAAISAAAEESSTRRSRASLYVALLVIGAVGAGAAWKVGPDVRARWLVRLTALADGASEPAPLPPLRTPAPVGLVKPAAPESVEPAATETVEPAVTETVEPAVTETVEPVEPTVAERGASEPAEPQARAKKPERSRARKRRRRRGSRRETNGETAMSAIEHYEQGLAHLRARKALLAIEELEQAIRLSPSLAEAYRALGKAHAMLGRKKVAIQALEEYLRLRPKAKDADSLRRLIHAHRQDAP